MCQGPRLEPPTSHESKGVPHNTHSLKLKNCLLFFCVGDMQQHKREPRRGRAAHSKGVQCTYENICVNKVFRQRAARGYAFGRAVLILKRSRTRIRKIGVFMYAYTHVHNAMHWILCVSDVFLIACPMRSAGSVYQFSGGLKLRISARARALSSQGHSINHRRREKEKHSYCGIAHINI